MFVVGHPRSGTTLLQLLMGTAPAVGTAPETHFFTYVMEPYASRIPIEFLGHKRRGPTDADASGQILKRLAAKPGIRLNSADEAELRKAIEPNPGDPRLVLDSIMRLLVTRSGVAARWLEKTPRHFFFIGDILNLFDDARVVVAQRDPRDVVSSAKRFQDLPPGSERLEIALDRCRTWMRAEEAATAATSIDRCHVVRYEDLISDPGTELGRLFDFAAIGVDPEFAINSFSGAYDHAVVAGEGARKGLLSEGKWEDRRGVWQSRMTRTEADRVVGMCSEGMERWGYAGHD